MTGDRMRKARGGLYAAATALSLAVHAVVVTALWLHAPKLVRPHEDAGPPEPIIPILILPRTPPPAPGSGQKPQPIRLHRRQLHPELPPPPEVPALVAPEQPPSANGAAETKAPAEPHITVQPSPAGQLSAVLRSSPIGCANPAILTPEERDACLARLGRGAGEAPYLPPALDRGKQSALDAAAAARDRNVRLKEAAPTAAIPNPDAGAGASNRNRPLYTPTLPPLRP
jgi:hypothetical protein